MERTVVEIKDYSCRYGKEESLNLKGISLEVKEGEFFSGYGSERRRQVHFGIFYQRHYPS